MALAPSPTDTVGDGAVFFDPDTDMDFLQRLVDDPGLEPPDLMELSAAINVDEDIVFAAHERALERRPDEPDSPSFLRGVISTVRSLRSESRHAEKSVFNPDPYEITDERFHTRYSVWAHNEASITSGKRPVLIHLPYLVQHNSGIGNSVVRALAEEMPDRLVIVIGREGLESKITDPRWYRDSDFYTAALSRWDVTNQLLDMLDNKYDTDTESVDEIGYSEGTIDSQQMGAIHTKRLIGNMVLGGATGHEVMDIKGVIMGFVAKEAIGGAAVLGALDPEAKGLTWRSLLRTPRINPLAGLSLLKQGLDIIRGPLIKDTVAEARKDGADGVLEDRIMDFFDPESQVMYLVGSKDYVTYRKTLAQIVAERNRKHPHTTEMFLAGGGTHLDIVHFDAFARAAAKSLDRLATKAKRLKARTNRPDQSGEAAA